MVFAVVPLSQEEAAEWSAMVAEVTRQPLTSDEGERMRDLLASGPLYARDIDARLVRLGLAEIEPGEGEERATARGTSLAHAFFYDRDGGIRQVFRWF